jgi:hypothetical protein
MEVNNSFWRNWSRHPALDSADILPLSAEWPHLCARDWIAPADGLGSLSLRVGADGVGRRLDESDINVQLEQDPTRQFPFIITGHPAYIPRQLYPEHCVRVEAWDASGRCDLAGLALVPPQLLLHVALYELDPVLGGVVVVQNLLLWEHFHESVPMLPELPAWSLPELSAGLDELLLNEGLGHSRIFTLESFPGCVVAFDATPREAVRRLLV